MLSSFILAVAGATIFATQSFAYVIPSGTSNTKGVLTPDRVRRDITPRQSASATASTTAGSGGSGLEIKITNSASDKMYAYIMGEDYTNGKKVFYQNGAAGWYYPTYSGASNGTASKNGAVDTSFNNLAVEVGGNSDTTVTLTEYLNSGRVYIGAAEMTFMQDPSGNLVEPSPVDTSDANYGFAWGIVELAWSDIELAADLSYVDSVGLALGMRVTTADGEELCDAGLPAGSLEKVCDSDRARGGGAR
ncbi:hypothetical protein INS49_013981 [Diaporthe citri]|uniref:uncharacterized protein n=1 Tax=Diaporthe citri TaxID=83186 RepID=UPI001C80D631|nr:uncharacterized protein INS49_013981 [Diaporthe citri]KAG6358097.1 hypothetical protein INS49_013981 [Diaporthe citri]